MKYCKNKLVLAALALLMSFSLSFKAYAAETVSVDDVKVILSSSYNGIDFSDYYYKCVREDSYGIMLIRQDIVDSYSLIVAYKHTYTDGNYQYRLGGFNGSEIVYINDNYGNGVSFNSSGLSTGTVSSNSFLYSTQYPCDFTTNIPLFDSMDSAYAYVLDGDTSGLLNFESLPKLYDPTIETPKDFQINFSTSKIFDDKGFFNECDFQFTWKQSEDTDVNGYQTEIYIQATHCKVSITNLFGSADSREQKLGDKLLISSASTSYDNKVSIKWNDLVAYLNKDGANLFGASNAGGVCCTYPIYFWIRNVKGNTYGDWIKVTVTPDNVVVDGNDYLGTGKGTVSHGYELVDGSGNGVQKENQYGQGYHVDIPYTSTNSIIDYIKSGFGLLGDNGLIAFFKDMFSFLPDPVWTIIFTMVGVCAIIMIIKVAK